MVMDSNPHDREKVIKQDIDNVEEEEERKKKIMADIGEDEGGERLGDGGEEGVVIGKEMEEDQIILEEAKVGEVAGENAVGGAEENVPEAGEIVPGAKENVGREIAVKNKSETLGEKEGDLVKEKKEDNSLHHAKGKSAVNETYNEEGQISPEDVAEAIRSGAMVSLFGPIGVSLSYMPYTIWSNGRSVWPHGCIFILHAIHNLEQW